MAMASSWQSWKNRSEYLSDESDAYREPNLAKRVLSLRGISEAERSEMLADRPPELYNPFALKDMDKAVETLLPVIEKQGKVLVHGDYDTDGVTSTAILLRSFRALGLEAIAYIPNRLTDGYGLAEAGVNAAIEAKVDLVVTCDCGVQSFAEVEALEQAGIPVIVTDHHSCLAELPQAHAVINPNRLDDHSVCRDLAGAGVALKLVQALGERLNRRNLWLDVIDLAALGTVGDSMKLRGENRSIVRHGLIKLREEACPGLAALMKAVKLDASLCLASDLAYKISPKINAAGRLGDSLMALELLLADDEETCTRLAGELLRKNSTRREIEAESVAEALDELKRHPDWLEHRGVVVSLKNGHAGVMGIIAQRLSERLACPVVALMLDSESDPGHPFWRGSARAFGEGSVLDLIQEASAYCRQFGGHHAAAGVEIDVDQLDKFRAAFQVAADAVAEESLSGQDRYYELELQPEDLSLLQAKNLAALEPFGEGHPEPCFMIRNVRIVEHRVIGQDKRHLRLNLSINGTDTVTAIYFAAASLLPETVLHADFIVRLHVNRFRGKETLQLIVIDHEDSLVSADRADSADQQMLEIELLYRTYDQWSGEELAAILGTDSDKLAPEKSILANLYRYLSTRLAGGPERLSVRELTITLESMYNIKTNNFHVRRVLDIYSEAGLLAVRQLNENERLLGLRRPEGKADLYGTPTWKRLAPSS